MRCPAWCSDYLLGEEGSARRERSLARERRYTGTAQCAANFLLHREERRVTSYTR